jgi:uncharacterized RDD family membrane protein YckC
MFCPQCGTSNPDDTRFCTNCGASLAAADGGPRTGTVPPPATPALTVVAAPHYAGFWRRFVAVFIDGIALSIPSGILNAIFGVSMFSAFTSRDMADAGNIGAMLVGMMWAGIVSFIISWLYYALMESSGFQATLGKMALGIIVTDTDGQRIGFARASARFFGKLISAIIIYIGFLMAAFTDKKQALHDIIAETLVIKKP